MGVRDVGKLLTNKTGQPDLSDFAVVEQKIALALAVSNHALANYLERSTNRANGHAQAHQPAHTHVPPIPAKREPSKHEAEPDDGAISDEAPPALIADKEYSVEEVAALLKVKRVTVFKLIRGSRIESFKRGKNRLFMGSEISRILSLRARSTNGVDHPTA